MNRAPPASGLPSVSKEVLDEIEATAAGAEGEAVEACLAEDPDAGKLGESAAETVRAGMRFLSDMLRAAVRYSEGGILEDEVEWARVRLPVSGVPWALVLRNVERYRLALARRLSAGAFATVAPYLDILARGQRPPDPGARSGG